MVLGTKEPAVLFQKLGGALDELRWPHLDALYLFLALLRKTTPRPPRAYKYLLFEPWA